MDAADLAGLDATASAELIRRGEVTPVEMVDAAIDRIERVNPALNAVIHERFEKARAEASSPDLPAVPFRGVPILAKDIWCHTAGDPYHLGMRFLRDRGWTEPADSDIAAALRRAGFVFVGSTNLPELGLMPTTEPEAFGPTRNPWDVTRSPGGSSGGAAAAVASRMVPLAHATDSGGSIRIPASACGLVGLKPSRDAIDVRGRILGDLNVQFAVTRSVRDAATLFGALAGSLAGDTERPAGPMRVGLMTAAPGGMTPVHPDCARAAEDAAGLLVALGHAVEAAYPSDLDDLAAVLHYGAITGADVAALLDRWSSRTGETIGEDDVEPHTWALAEMGRAITEDHLRASLGWLAGFTDRVVSWWRDGFDLLLTPTMAEPPPPLGELVSTKDAPLAAGLRAGVIAAFTPPFNTTGQPAISLPLHWNEAGLPIGVQLVAAPGRDDLLLAIAAQLEEARPWRDRHPTIDAGRP